MIHIFASLHMLFFSLKNLLRYESCTYLVKFPWQYKSDALQNVISSASLTPSATHTLATCLFPVSRDLSSGNDIGFHTIELLLTLAIHGSHFCKDVTSTLLFINYTHMQ